MMNNSTGIRRHSILGLNSAARCTLSFLDNDVLCYVAGRTVVVCDLKNGAQRFVDVSTEAEAVTALCACCQTKTLAIAEKHPVGALPKVRLYNFNPSSKFDELILENNETDIDDGSDSAEVVSMSFSHGGKFLVSLSTESSARLVLTFWDVSRKRLAAAIAIGQSISNPDSILVSFHPSVSSLFCVSHDEELGFFRIQGNEERCDVRRINTTINNSPRDPADKLLCHCWLQQEMNQIVFGTDRGDLLLYEETDLKYRLPTSDSRIDCLVATKSGFVASSGTTFRFYRNISKEGEKSSEVTSAKWTTMWTLKPSDQNEGRCMSMVISPDQETLGVLFSRRNEVSCFGIAPSSNRVADGIAVSPSSFLVSSGHVGPICGFDLCICKPFLISVGSDGCLRLWDYISRKEKVFKHFQGEPLCVSLHPMGFHALIGFRDKLRLMKVLHDDMLLQSEFPIKMCKMCKFSKGGQLFAAAQGPLVVVYMFYTASKKLELRGHNNKIIDLAWGPSDSTIVTCDDGGTLYLWCLSTGHRIGEFILGGMPKKCHVLLEDEVVWVAESNCINQFSPPDLTLLRTFDQQKGEHLGPIACSTHGVLFCAVQEPRESGNTEVRAFLPPKYDKMVASVSIWGVVTMRLTKDERFLVVSDVGGCLTMLDISDVAAIMHRQNPITADRQDDSSLRVVGLMDDVLVTKSDLEVKEAAIVELQSNINETILQNEYKARRQEMSFSEKLKETISLHTRTLEESSRNIALVQEDTKKMRDDYEERISNLKKEHVGMLHELEESCHERMLIEIGRYQKAVRQRDIFQKQSNEQRQLLEKSHQDYISSLVRDWEEKLDETKRQRKKLEEEKRMLEDELQEMKRQIEDDTDTEVENTKLRHQQLLSVEREAMMNYCSKNGLMKEKSIMLKQEIELQKEQIQKGLDIEQDLHQHAKKMEHLVQTHEDVIQARQATISEKDKMINVLGKKNKVLQTYTFCLQNKMEELMEQVEPRNKEMESMEQQTSEVDAALKHSLSRSLKLENATEELSCEITNTKRISCAQRKRISDQSRLMHHLTCGLHDCSQLIQDQDSLRDKFMQLLPKDFTSDKTANSYEDEVHTSNFEEQHDILERKLRALREKHHKAETDAAKENANIRSENMAMLDEIKVLQDENKRTRKILQERCSR